MQPTRDIQIVIEATQCHGRSGGMTPQDLLQKQEIRSLIC